MAVRKIRNTWWVDFRFKRDRLRKRSPENSRAGAMEYEAMIRQKLARGESLEPAPAPTPSPTFAAFSAEWLEVYVRTNNKPSVQESEARILRIHLVPFFGKMRLNKIEHIDIERYKAEKLADGLKTKTINNHLGILAKCLNTAVEWKQDLNPIRIKRLRTPTPPFKFLTPTDSACLLAAWESHMWQAMAQVALHTGLRLGELFGLRWQDIDFDNRQLTVRQSIVNGIVGVPKNYRERTVPLTGNVIAALKILPHRGELAFTRENGEALTRGMAQNAILHACRKAGIQQIGWHTLRHTFASHLGASGVPITSIQALLGHSSINMTMRYTHTSPSALRDAVHVLETQPIGPSPYFWATGGQHLPILPAEEKQTEVQRSHFSA
jgi:integrase